MRQNVHRSSIARAFDIEELARTAARSAGITPEEWLHDLAAELDLVGHGQDGPESAMIARRLNEHVSRRGATQSPADRSRPLSDRPGSLDQRAGPRESAADRSSAQHQGLATRGARRAELASTPDQPSRAEHLVETLRSDVSALAERIAALYPAREEIDRLELAMTGLAGRDDVSALEQSIRRVADELERISGASPAQEAELRSIQERLDDVSEQIERDHVGRADQAATGDIARQLDLISHKLDIVSKSQALDLSNQIEALSGKVDSLASTPLDIDVTPAMETLARRLETTLASSVESHGMSDIAERLDGLVDLVNLNHGLHSTRALEREIRALSDRIETVRRGDTASADLRPLIEGLAHKIDAAVSEPVQRERSAPSSSASTISPAWWNHSDAATDPHFGETDRDPVGAAGRGSSRRQDRGGARARNREPVTEDRRGSGRAGAHHRRHQRAA